VKKVRRERPGAEVRKEKEKKVDLKRKREE
jgi:hypothetical protein